MDYEAWDDAIQTAISQMPDDQAVERAQLFLRQFPAALTQFRATVATTTFVKPLADFQRHPTYLLRFLLAEWQDEAKVARSSLDDIMKKSIERLHVTQEWRNGKGDNWSRWGFKDMDECYETLRTPPDVETALNKWFFCQFCGLDSTGRPLHYDLIASSYEKTLVLPMAIRRTMNNEHTLRHRMILLNPAPAVARNGLPLPPGSSERTDVLSNPILGATWILDARKLSIWSASSLYKVVNELMDNSIKLTGVHYPEQGYRAYVINLGLAFGTMYNLLIKVMPATTQATTKCYIGNDILKEVVGCWDNVPEMFKTASVTQLTPEEQVKYRGDLAPFVSMRT